MDALEIIKIIKACRKAKVQEIKFGELELKFQTGEAVKPRAKVESPNPPTEQELERARLEAMTASNDSVIDDELATLQIEDPEAFEQLLIQRELTFENEGSEKAAYDH